MQTILVTGGAYGTGHAIAEKFAQAGYRVYLTSREGERAHAAEQKLCEAYGDHAARGFELSPGDEAAISALFEAIQAEGHPLAALVLNAANLGHDLDSFSCELALWANVTQTNMVWNYALARAAAQRMRETGGGSIVFIASNTARRAIKGRSAYIASKGGMIALAKALAADWGEYHIRVNSLLPGAIRTERWDAHPAEWQRAKARRGTLPDIADFEDIANGVFYLATDLSKAVTGTELIIDGGVDGYMCTPDM